jgi:PPP family 3-phenylpropionic acid transporter
VRGIRAQYFLTYGAIGSVMPFLPVFLDERGLSRTQIGYVMGAASLGVVLTPVLITLLADTAVAGRVLMAGLFAIAASLLATMVGLHGFWPILACYTLHALAFAPVAPLQDGVYFAAAARDPTAPPYHAVRVWGTFGYIAPSAVLYFVLTRRDDSVAPAMIGGALMCFGGMLNALLFLPRADRQLEKQIETRAKRLPTVAAARALLEPHALVFCIAMCLVHFAAAGYYQLYPLYLTDAIGIEKQWVGLIAMIGVVIEIFFMLGFGRLTGWMTLRGFMIVGVAGCALRLLLLAMFATHAVAIGTQVFHGLMALVVHVAPPIYLNRRAGDAYRSSIQGLYAMIVAGGARIVGSIVTGRVAEHSLTATFALCAGLFVLAAGLFFFAFREGKQEVRNAASESVAAAA